MEESSEEIGVEVREEMMVSLTGCGNPTRRLAHFLKPCVNSIKDQVFELPAQCLPSIPVTSEPKKRPLKLKFYGWRLPQDDWKKWVEKMAALHESTWKKAGIREAIFNSTYEIRRSDVLVLRLAEKWCPETKSFIFSWGEATITLEDMMISGYSVLGSPVFSPLEADEMKAVEAKLNQVRMELQNSASQKANHSIWLKRFMDRGSEIEHEAFLALWLSRFVFPFSFKTVSKSVFPIALHLARGTRIALAPAVLASIYRDFSLLKEKIVAFFELDSCEGEVCEFVTIIRSPFQLVQCWACERFIELRPTPNPIKKGEPRFARWHKIRIRVENVRTVLDSAKDSFHWRPYVRTLKNWDFPMFYGEKDMWVSIDADVTEEILSFARCLRVSKLVALDCIEQYLPHRVAMQFGMDQDLPASVAWVNESCWIAWTYYSKPVTNATLYISSRFFEADVTTRYLEWWKQSLSCLQGASDGTLPHKRILTSSEIAPNRSKGRTKRGFNSFDGKPGRASEMKSSVSVSQSRLKSERSKRTNKRNFTSRTNTMPRKLDRTKELVCALSSPYISLTVKESSLGTSKQKRSHAKASVAHGSTLKRAKSSVQISDKEKEVIEASASAELPSKKLQLSLIAMMEADNSPVPPGFPPKFYLVQARDSTNKDNLANKDSLKSSKKQNDIQNANIGDGENSLHQSQTFSPLITDNKGVKIFEPLSMLAKKVMQNEPANGGPETPIEDATASAASCVGQDMVRNQGSDEDGKNYGCEVPEELEAWVSRLEKIVAELKAERFGFKRPVIGSE